MLQKIINFIKYHNAVSIGISLILVLSFSVMASEDIRGAVLGEKIITEQGVDNSALLVADLDNFDLAMEITNVTEDSESSNNSENNKTGNYYIDYQYETLGIQGDVWLKNLRQKQMVISKAALGGRDLGLYVSEELGEIIDNEIAYLKEVQENEREKGQTFVQETTKYTGLIGLVLDTKTKELPGYEPVVKPPEIVVQPEPAPINQPELTNPITPAPPLEGGDSANPVDSVSPTPTEEPATPATPTTPASDDSDSDQENLTSTPTPAEVSQGAEAGESAQEPIP